MKTIIASKHKHRKIVKLYPLTNTVLYKFTQIEDKLCNRTLQGSSNLGNKIVKVFIFQDDI